MRKQAANASVLVMGNSGADLDSVASALVFAWHLQAGTQTKGSVALVAAPRHCLPLRPELTYLLNKAGIAAELLIFVDEIALPALLKNGASLALVDHNCLEPSLAHMAPTVSTIIDHHHDEGEFPEAQPRIIRTVGSTATLVAELILGERGTIPPQAALLLAGAILLDTANLSPEAKRATSLDQAMAAQLLAICDQDQHTLFHEVLQAQYNVDSLSSAELLSRDYKQWNCSTGRYGMASVLGSLENWQRRDADLGQALAHFAEKQEIDLLIVMLASHEPHFQRQLISYCRTTGQATELEAFLHQQDLGLRPISGKTCQASAGAVRVYQQGNTKKSRKQLQPALHLFLEGTLARP